MIKQLKLKDQSKNPYEKIFDDANRFLKKTKTGGILDKIPNDLEHNRPIVPIPYGSNKPRPYSWTIKQMASRKSIE